jgi:hypothetical protein
MYTEWGYMGVTRHVDTGDEPWEPLDFDTVVASDKALQAQGKLRRPLIIGIMGEYVTALKESDPSSERHIRAVFKGWGNYGSRSWACNLPK